MTPRGSCLILLGGFSGPFWKSLVASRVRLGAEGSESEIAFSPRGPILSPSWDFLGPFWAPLGPSRGSLGLCREPARGVLGRLGA
eukprot:8598942-Pyramimonas_sp.AAC.1